MFYGHLPYSINLSELHASNLKISYKVQSNYKGLYYITFAISYMIHTSIT